MGEWKGVEEKPKCDGKRKVKSDSVGSKRVTVLDPIIRQFLG
jgi:hypothetical protein